jgi:acyl-CoA hydrolase
MEVGIKAIAENLISLERRHTTSCYFTMVAKDDSGKSIPVPALDIVTELDHKLHEAARMRLDMRREIAQRNQALHIDLEEPS